MDLKTALVTVIGILAVTSVVIVGYGGSQPVHATDVSCDTGTGVRCDAVLVNENDDTGYRLAVTVIGYDKDGTVVTTYTNDATDGGGGIVDVSPGGTANVTISTSSPERVATADVRVVEAQAYED
jgi:hypothetical protein